MTKKFYAITNLLLSSLIALLGFGSCKTAKKVEKENKDTNAELFGVDTIKPMPGKEAILLYAARPIKKEIRLLYGPAPINKAVPIDEQEKKEK